MQECLTLQPEEDAILDFDAIERWTVMHCPLFDKIFLYVLAASFGLDAGNDEFCLLPTQGEQLMVLMRILILFMYATNNSLSYQRG